MRSTWARLRRASVLRRAQAARSSRCATRTVSLEVNVSSDDARSARRPLHHARWPHGHRPLARWGGAKGDVTSRGQLDLGLSRRCAASSVSTLTHVALSSSSDTLPQSLLRLASNAPSSAPGTDSSTGPSCCALCARTLQHRRLRASLGHESFASRTLLLSASSHCLGTR